MQTHDLEHSEFSDIVCKKLKEKPSLIDKWKKQR